MNDAIQQLGMPKWGLSMTEGRVLEWLVDDGAEIQMGDEVAEVETDKLSGVVKSPVAGTIRRRVASEGDVVPVGGLLAVLADSSITDDQIDAFVADFQESFVPGEAEEDAGPSPETVEVEAAGTLRFLRQGEGDQAVVLLHGFGGDLNNWMFTLPALAGEHSVYALELPGHGGSSKAVGSGDLDSLATAVEQFLDSQGIEHAHLVGHSLGGLVASTVALRSPDRVQSLTLVSSAGLGDEINVDYIEGFISADNRRALKTTLTLLFANPDQVTRQLVDDVLKYKRIDGVTEALEAIARHLVVDGHQGEVVAPSLGSLDVPILVVWGAQDQIIPASHAQKAPERAEIHVLEGSGHSPHMEAAGEVNRLFEQFVGSLS